MSKYLKTIQGIPRKRYDQIHHWLRKTYGKAYKCEEPTCMGKSITYQWALNKSYDYAFNRENFTMLCKSCHAKSDVTDETRRKLSNPNKMGAHKPVIGTNDSGGVMYVFKSSYAASKAFKVVPTGVSNNICRGTKTKGFKFEYFK